MHPQEPELDQVDQWRKVALPYNSPDPGSVLPYSVDIVNDEYKDDYIAASSSRNLRILKSHCPIWIDSGGVSDSDALKTGMKIPGTESSSL